MYRIRFHGRGGQGLKTASRILGTAFFLEGFEVQDAPRYGAERRGAPIFAYVRADKQVINERGIISQADLVIVADDSLVGIVGAGVLQGVNPGTILIIYSPIDAETWQHRLGLKCKIISIPPAQTTIDSLTQRYTGAICAGAAAQLCGVISKENLQQAIQQELQDHDEQIIDENIHQAITAYAAMQTNKGIVKPSSGANLQSAPKWTELNFENAQISAPAIHAADNSEAMQTGLWRTMKPIIEYDHCNRCWWVCSTYCPDGAIKVTKNNYPKIDYEHCKGCMVCVSQCPPHAIIAVAEHDTEQKEFLEPPA